MIKVWDYLDEYEQERDTILAAVDGVFKSGQLILGEQVNLFEKEFASYIGANQGVGVDNATNGLFLALKAAGIGKGDEVITVANTAVPTVSAIVSSGATPVFVDVCSKSHLMDVSQLCHVLTERTKAVLPVHLYGQVAKMEVIENFAELNGLIIIEDCAQSHGATRFGVQSGNFGTMGVFSFYPTKPLGGYGDGALITAKDEITGSKLRKMRFYGMEKTYYAKHHGYNSRLDEVHAAILRTKLPKLEQYNTRRREIANIYNEELAKLDLSLPSEIEGNNHIYYVYVVKHEARDRIIEELRRHEIFLNISYPYPIHTMTGYESLGYKLGSLPVTEKLSSEIFSLPMYPSLTNQKVERVIDLIKKIIG